MGHGWPDDGLYILVAAYTYTFEWIVRAVYLGDNVRFIGRVYSEDTAASYTTRNRRGGRRKTIADSHTTIDFTHHFTLSPREPSVTMAFPYLTIIFSRFTLALEVTLATIPLSYIS
jgi:hypothetical protein